ncbi:MAG: diaminopimelate epimerase [Verrucomicrobiota bacterium]|jgi:diaminopimelate epimerase
MMLDFVKMNGAGNDFVLVDNRAGKVRLDTRQIIQLCDRHRGIGADGLFLLIPNASGKADWSWEFHNSDGSVADMCGNGARCFARFVQSVAGAREQVSFETGAGIITARFHGTRVTIDLTEPGEVRLEEIIPVGGAKLAVHSINTGVPHAIVFVPDADQAMVQAVGAEIRHHPHFKPRGTNVNFAQVLGPNHLRVRTYERGVEGETLACGTGVTAAALVSSRVHQFKSPVKVQVQGGDTLEVSWTEAEGRFTSVRLNGPADFVFKGTIEI